MRMKTLRWMLAIGIAFATQACVVREAPPVNAGYYPQGRIASAGVATPQPYAVSTLPPDPLFEQMTASPGMGHVWIDGSWHWNGYEWVWVSGRWEQDQSDHVYVQPYYDYSGDTYIYTPGYWSSRERLPRGSIVRDHRDGRPSVVAPRPRPSRPPVANPQPHDPYRPPASRHPGGRDLIGPGDSGPITAPRPTYDPNGGGTYRPAQPTYRPPAPADGGYRPNTGYRPPAPTAPPAYQPPQRDVGGMPSTPMTGGGPVPAGGYGPPPVYNPDVRGPGAQPGRNPPPTYAPPARPAQPNYGPPARPAQDYAPPARTAPPQGAPVRTAPPPPPPARTAPPPPPPSNATPPRRR